MNTNSTIIKSLIFPLVNKFAKEDLNMLPDTFWNQFAADFIRYEIDATPIYATLYQLELQDPEAVFEKLQLSNAKHVEYYTDILFGLSALLDEITKTLV